LSCSKTGRPPFGNGAPGPGPSCWPWACCAAGGGAPFSCALCFWDRQHQDWSAPYKLFSRSRWQPRALFTPVLQRAISRYCPRYIPIGLDDTRLKKSGKKVPPAFWSRDPLSPRFRANLLWGQRFLQASLLVALYQQDGQSGPRGLPGRFEEVPAVRKPGKKASPQAQAAYRRAQKAPNLSTAFVAMVQELRRCLDALGFGQKVVLAVGDGSFCNQTTFRRPFERTVLLTRARKNLRLCFPYQGPGRRVYTTAKTALPPRRFIKLRACRKITFTFVT
jgi:DDE superfamily endonuclease